MKVSAANELYPLATVALLDRELPRARLVSGDLSGLQSLQGGKEWMGSMGRIGAKKIAKADLTIWTGFEKTSFLFTNCQILFEMSW